MLKKENNPWLGLASYEYKDAYRFFGREKELVGLKDAICNNLVTTIYGISGAGKTSLINAGISPLLEKDSYLPVRIRLDHCSPRSYSEQIIAAVKTNINEAKGEIESLLQTSISDSMLPDSEKLWWFFHTSLFWSESNHHICPVILIDQFEEIFTKNKDSKIIQSFFDSINSLQYNVPPITISKILEEQEEYSDFNSTNNFRLVFIMREDFLARLEDYAYDIPILRKNRVGIKRMNGLQAKEVILRPMPEIVNEDVALQIINKVSGHHVKNEPAYLEHLSIDTSILSLFCSELYDKAVEQKMEIITRQLINQFGENILSSFYDNTMKLVLPSTAEFLETHLLTRSGFRNSMALEDILENGITQKELEILNQKRLIRIETLDGTDRVEYTHDVLCEIAKQHRDKREEQKEKKSGIRKTIWFAIEIICTFAFFFWLVYFLYDKGNVLRALFTLEGITQSENIWAIICSMLLLINSFVVLPAKYARDKNFSWLAACLMICDFILFMVVGVIWDLNDELAVIGSLIFFSYPMFLIFSNLRHKKRKAAKEYLKDVATLNIYKQNPSFIKVLEVLSVIIILIISFAIGLLLKAEYTYISVPILSIIGFLLLADLINIEIKWNWRTCLLLAGQVVCLIILVQSQFIIHHLLIMLIFWGILGSSIFYFSKKWTIVLGLWIITFFLIPIMNMGYNVFSGIEYARVHNSTINNHRINRFIVIEDANHLQGVRDRWNIVVPTEFDSIGRKVYFKDSEEKPYDIVFHTYKDKQFQEWHCANHLDITNTCTDKIVSTYGTYQNAIDYVKIVSLPQYLNYINTHKKGIADIKTEDIVASHIAHDIKNTEKTRIMYEWVDELLGASESQKLDSLRVLYNKTDSLSTFDFIKNDQTSIGALKTYDEFCKYIKSNFDLIAADKSGYAGSLLLDSIYGRFKGEADNISYYVSLSYYKLFARDFSGAEESARMAISIDSLHTISYTNLFTALYMQGKYEEAWPILQKYKDINLATQDSIFKYFGDGIWEDFNDLIQYGVYQDINSEEYNHLKEILKDYIDKPRYDAGILWLGRELRQREMEDGRKYWYLSYHNEVLTPIMDGYYWHTDGIDSVVWYRTNDTHLIGYYLYCGSDSLTINAIYNHGWFFSEGLAAVEKDGKIGFINRKGEYEIAPVFEYQYDKAKIADKVDFVFHDGYCPMVSAPGKHGLINKRGEWTIPPIYSYINNPINGYRIVRLNNKYGLMDKNLNLVLPIEYSWINQNEDNTITIDKETFTYTQLSNLFIKK